MIFFQYIRINCINEWSDLSLRLISFSFKQLNILHFMLGKQLVKTPKRQNEFPKALGVRRPSWNIRYFWQCNRWLFHWFGFKKHQLWRSGKLFNLYQYKSNERHFGSCNAYSFTLLNCPYCVNSESAQSGNNGRFCRFE